jgi:NAD-dependent dihydropyrimidine dehydrogenase PreA subunit
MFKPHIDEDLCTGCGECVDICPNEVLELSDEKASVIDEEECVGCESCVEVCEQGAITVEEI